MSQSAKMGLFGSKDGNTESTNEDKNMASGSKENSPERYAPYSIDSDSETYDTEALSIMDINDIIGVQSDAPGESTLESEFAALSEIITGTKDEILPQTKNSAGARDKAGTSDLEENPKDWATKGMASMSKSLQLIGEAYTSDDSQESTVDEGAVCTEKKPSTFSETLCSAGIEETSEKSPEDLPKKEIESTSIDIDKKIIIVEAKDDLKIETESAECDKQLSEATESPTLDKSADLTDSSHLDNLEEPVDSKIETMDVDSLLTSDIIENSPVENKTLEETEDGKDKIEEIIEEKNPAVDFVEKEEAMEVDEPMVEILLKPAENLPSVQEKSSEDSEEALEAPEIENSILINDVVDAQPEDTEIKKASEEDLEKPPKSSKEPETIENLSSPVPEKQDSQAVENESEPEPVENKEDSEKLSAMETDELLEESILEEVVPPEIPSQVIEESLPEKSEEKIEKIETNLSLENEVESEQIVLDAEQVTEIVKVDFLVEREEVIESMEIDVNFEEENNEPQSPEALSEVHQEQENPKQPETKAEDIETSSELTTAISDIVETVVEASVSASTLEDSQDKSVPITLQSSEKSSEIIQVLPTEASTDIMLKESFQGDIECLDEKMEVDSSVETRNKESKVHSTVQEMETISKQENILEKTTEEACGVDTVDEAQISPPDVVQEICETSSNVLDKISSTESQEIVTEELCNEAAHKNEEETIISETSCEIECKAIAETEKTEVPEELNDKNKEKVETDFVLTENSQSSTDVEKKIEEPEEPEKIEIIDEKACENAEMEIKEKESVICPNKDKSPSILEEIVEESPTIKQDKEDTQTSKEETEDCVLSIEADNKKILVETDESSIEKEKETSVVIEESTLSNNENAIVTTSENNESSIEIMQEMEAVQSPKEIEEDDPKDEDNSNAIVQELEVPQSIEETANSQPLDQDKCTFSKAETSMSSTIPIEQDIEEDPVEMNLTLDPEILESPESPDEEVNRIGGSSPERMTVDDEEEMEDNVDINLSLDPEEKEDCAEDKVDEEPEVENLNKSVDDQDDSSKDILSVTRVTDIFHDDEQSQTTQEMMESILETDTGNINKILDDEEASDALECAREKLPSDELLNKELEDPISSQNIDSLEGLLDLDLMPENEEAALKAVEPIVEKVMKASLLMEDNDPREAYDSEIVDKIVKNENDEIMPEKTSLQEEASTSQLETSGLTENDLEAFDLTSVVANPLESIDPTDETKLDLDEDILCEIADERKLKLSDNLLLSSAIDEEVKIELTQQLLIENSVDEEKIILPEDLLLSSSSIEDRAKIDLADEVFLTEPDESVANMELSEDISLESAVRDEVLSEVAAEIENLPPSSEISELESAVKFLQESEEQDIDSPLVLSPKLVESVVDEIAKNSEVGIFSSDGDIGEDPTELATELDAILPDPIAISEAEIISEAAKLENEKKEKLSEETKLPIVRSELVENVFHTTPPIRDTRESLEVSKHTETPKTHRETRETISKSFEGAKIEYETLKKSAPIPKISLLEERLKIPPKIEIPQGELSRLGDVPTTPKTSLLIQRDAKMSSFQKMLDSPKSMEKGELRIVDGPKKETERQHDFENVGSPRIILKIAKSAIADCSEPRSPKSPKIRSATNSPNPEDSPGQKLGKIKLKLSKGGHPSIIPNDNVEELCGQWHTEGSSSLSPLGMKIKFSKIADSSSVEKHEEETREQPKHKFEEAKRTESPIGMKIKLSRTGEPSIVQQDGKDNATKHKEKMEIIQQGSPKRTESPIGMKIKLSKSGDASIIQPDKQESMEDYKDGSSRTKDKLDISQQHTDRNEMPRRTESPLGMKFKLFKTGDASIVQPESPDDSQQEIITKRTDSPLGMKIKLSKNRGSASIVSSEISDDTKDKLEIPEVPRRTESPLGMKIKLSKTGDASIIHSEESRESMRQRTDAGTQETTQMSEVTLGVKIKVGKSGDASIIQPDVAGEMDIGSHKRSDPTIGMKIKLSKSGDASIVHPERDEHVDESRGKERLENTQEGRKIDSSIGMKIKLSKSGDASIIQSQSSKKIEDQSASVELHEPENQRGDAVMAMKIKLQKSGDGTIVDSDKKEKSLRRKETEMPLEMKIKLSKTGHPTIVACDNYSEGSQRGKESTLENSPGAHTSKHKEQSLLKESSGMKMLKSMHSAGLHRSELTIEPIQSPSRKAAITEETSKRKEITISPVESKKAKLEATLSQMLPEVTIQPVKPREKKQMVLDTKTASISRQQMNVITQEISITQVRTSKPMDLTMTDKLKSMLAKKTTTTQECQIIEHRPELIIVNENSNSSQDVMIIEEVPALRGPESKVPKKRGRPRRNPLPLILSKPVAVTEPIEPILQRDPLALDDLAQMPSTTMPQNFLPKETENRGRPKRTCRSQKSYAPPRRGRGRGGRGKRKMDMEMELSKRPRIDQDLEMIERSTTDLISLHDQPTDVSHTTSELYKALRQPTMDRKMPNAMARVEVEQAVNDRRNDPDLMTKDHLESLMDARLKSHLDSVIGTTINKSRNDEAIVNDDKVPLIGACRLDNEISINSTTEDIQKSDTSISDDKIVEKTIDESKDIKDSSIVVDHQNWLTPSSKKQLDGRNEGNISNVQVIDEETRMSAESNSRSQTPARNMTVQAPETIVNEESQGSVLSTATTESEKVKVKIRRMEITLDPDEGPFTVDKVAEYDWPPDPLRKGETFMIQEQISQFLGVKSFKRKYPDLKRRMVDMEERNFLRENGLVSEAMCDMGLTAVSSSEVLDVMCSDFPEQYEEYRKYIREKQMKEHSKKQKELTAAANAEKNRIDLAEMAVQSALSWNVGLNKARRESRKCSLDLQTFTIHVPKKQQRIEEDDRGNHYPVALIPGQYTDYYREYTPAELRYYPLNTVLYGPMRPNERKFDSQSEGSQSDSDSDSSSDDSSSSSSSEGTQDTEASQSTMDDVDAELSRQKEDIKSIKCKMCLKHLNKFSRTEVLIQCGTCNGYVHPSCIDLTLDMVPHIQAYAWQCTDCKTCAQCHDPADEDKMLFCDMCDRGYHIYCVGLRRVPQGRWHCQECAVCASCGSREAGGANSDRNSVAQWQHEYKKGDKNTRVYVSTLCVPCSKLWRKGRYCPHCSRCHTVPRLDLEANLVHCSACDKYLHLGCVETKDLTIDRKNYLCDFCQPLRHHMVKPLVSKVFRT